MCVFGRKKCLEGSSGHGIETLSVPDNMLGPVGELGQLLWGLGGWRGGGCGGATQVMSTGKAYTGPSHNSGGLKAAGKKQELHINSCHIKKV